MATAISVASSSTIAAIQTYVLNAAAANGVGIVEAVNGFLGGSVISLGMNAGNSGKILSIADEAAAVVDDAAKGAVQAESKVFIVTKEGVVLPKGAKIPDEFVENPYRSSSYGIIQNGKFVEKLRIDPATPAGMKGPNYSHYHLNGSGKHLTDNWPWW